MKIVCVGGGPAGLYFAIRAKLGDPARDITVLERHPAGVTYGWGVGYWDDLLSELYRNDPVSARRIQDASGVWDGVQLHVGDRRPAYLGGYRLSMGRQRLLDILAERATQLGVEVRFEHPVADPSTLATADLVAAAEHGAPGTLSPLSMTSSTARSSAIVSAWTMFSRVTGLLRVVVIGAVLGPTYFANSFLAANSVPSLTYTAVAGPVMGLVLVPAVVRSLSSAGERATAELVGRVSGYLLLIAGLAAAALALASPLLALAVTAGIPDPALREHAWRLTVLVVLFVAPQVMGYTVAGIGEAVQQARGRFVLAAAAPALENVGLMARSPPPPVPARRPPGPTSSPTPRPTRTT